MHSQSSKPFIPAAQALPAIIEALPPDADHAAQFQFTRARQIEFLRLLADCGEVRAAARSSAVSHQTVYRLRRSCSTFRRAVDAALLVARELAEDLLATRAMNGVEEEVYYHGEVVAKRRRFDSRLLLAHLARLDRKAEDDDVAGLAANFDALLEALGSEDEGAAEALVNASIGRGAGRTGSDNPTGACNMRSMSAEDEWEDDDEDDAPGGSFQARLDAMDEARPDDAPPLSSLAHTVDEIGEIEERQMAAFEAGEERWWEVKSNPCAGSTHDIQANARVASADHADPLCCAARQVDLSPTDEGAAVVDANGDGASIAGVGDAHQSAEGQRLMRGGHGVHVEAFTIGSQAAMEAAAVIGGHAGAHAADDTACGGFGRWNLNGGLECVEINGVGGEHWVDCVVIGADRLDDAFELSGKGDVGYRLTDGLGVDSLSGAGLSGAGLGR